MPDVKLSQLAAASAASVAAGAGLWTMAGHILGLRMEYVGPAAVRVSSGSAWIPSLQQAIELPAALTLSGLTLAANTWYHLYLYLNGSTPAIEAVTDAPAAPYSGTARAKTGAASRRYIGSVRTNASGRFYEFDHNAAKGEVVYRMAGSQLRVLSNGASTAPVIVACGSAIPTTSRSVCARVLNLSASANLVVGPGDAALTTNDHFIGVSYGGQAVVAYLPTDSTQQLLYMMSAAQAGAYIDVYGYAYER